MPYFALKPLKVQGKRIVPGEEVPGAEHFPTIRALIAGNFIVGAPDDPTKGHPVGHPTPNVEQALERMSADELDEARRDRLLALAKEMGLDVDSHTRKSALREEVGKARSELVDEAIEDKTKSQLTVRAKELGILDKIKGSGAGGNVLKEDLIKALKKEARQ